jgi:Bacterial archaeo-eukaryotic release factor family 7
MNALSQDELKTLLGKHQGLCISIFMPTFRTGAESQQNQIRFRNLLRSAEEKLLAGGLRPQEIKTLLEPAQALPGNVLFWRRQSDGLALFISTDLFRCFCLPEAFAELIVVADHFHVKPLLTLLGSDKRFYILALSQKEVRLLEGTGQNIREIELESVPRSLTEALQYDEFGKQVRFRAGTAGGGDRSAMVSGHGAEIDDTKDNLLKYFRLIDRGLHDLLRDEQAPLVLAGVDYLFPIYRETNTYPRLIEEGIPGNPQGISAETLHRAGLKIVSPCFQKAEHDAVAQYRQSSGTGLTSADSREIIPAAYHGRVGLLLVASGRQQWGTFNGESGAVERHHKMGDASEDLLEMAAIQTFLNGGTVFTLPPEKMPDTGDIAAVFRY